MGQQNQSEKGSESLKVSPIKQLKSLSNNMSQPPLNLSSNITTPQKSAGEGNKGVMRRRLMFVDRNVQPGSALKHYDTNYLKFMESIKEMNRYD
jgi:hypothetical protein